MMKLSIILTLCLLSVVTIAQVPTRNISPEKLQDYAKFMEIQDKSVNSVVLPTIDVSALLAEDEREKDWGKPPRFGKDLDVDLGLTTSGSWERISGGRIWRLQIKVPDAHTVNMIFDRFFLPKGATVFIYNGDKTMISGPIDDSQNSKSGMYSTSLLKGSSVTIELFEPDNAYSKSQLHISKIIHGYKQTPFAGFGDSAPCNINVNCAQGNAWNDEKNMVAMVLLQNNTRWCSGTMLNNACQNMTPNFLTAFHCLDANLDGNASAAEITDAQNWQFMLQYMSPNCNPNTDDPNFFTFSGSTYRAGWNVSDFALVQLNQRPTAATGIRYAGWSRINAAANSSVSLHHPKGDVMKISVENNQAASVDWNGGLPNTHWLVNFDDGTVEPGSSGSPLFNQNHRVVGQLHGGRSDITQPNDGRCNFRDARYGRFDVSWDGGGTAATRLRDWLTDNPSVTEVGSAQIPTITGPSPLCSTAQYNVNNAPSGSITWSSSNSSIASINLTSGAATRIATGFVTITASISTSCGINTLTKTIWVGEPGFFDISGRETICAINLYQYNITANNPFDQADYSWSPSSPNLSLSGSGSSAIASSWIPGTYLLNVTAQNACGTSFNSLGIEVIDCFIRYAVYPNPAKDQISIRFDDFTDASALPDEILLLSEHTTKPVRTIAVQEAFERKAMEQGNTLKIDVRDLPRGIYYLHIKNSRRQGKEVGIIRILLE